MASKEDIEKRVQDEAEKVIAVYVAMNREPIPVALTAAIRPLVERMIELEEEGAELRERLDGSAPKLAAAEARGDELAAAMVREGDERARLTGKFHAAEIRIIEQDRQIATINSDRSRLAADLTEARAELRTKGRELDEERAAKHDVLRGRTMAENTIVELRASIRTAHAELRTATREHDETAAALRAQVTALQGVIDGHEQAIRDACADVRAGYAEEHTSARLRHDRLTDKLAALGTTVDVLAGRLAQRGGG